MTQSIAGTGRVAAVIIGRNEGARLVACLGSLSQDVRPLVYVDSGSTDGSIAAASAAGAVVVPLDTSIPFTAARARNAGFARLGQEGEAEFVQFVDGDCQLQPNWLKDALDFMAMHPKAGVVCGRRREIRPEASVWNRLCDAEWDTSVGLARACGGDALMRTAAFRQVGGFNPNLIAGEEPELCVRLRAAGWEIWRIDAEMTLHDAAMYRVGQWWKRTRRAGYAFAEGAALHGQAPEFHWVAETRRALLWGLFLPLCCLVGLIFTPWAALGFALYPVQILRLAPRLGLERALFLTLGKVPEALGVLQYRLNSLLNRRAALIEYK